MRLQISGFVYQAYVICLSDPCRALNANKWALILIFALVFRVYFHWHFLDLWANERITSSTGCDNDVVLICGEPHNRQVHVAGFCVRLLFTFHLITTQSLGWVLVWLKSREQTLCQWRVSGAHVALAVTPEQIKEPLYRNQKHNTGSCERAVCGESFFGYILVQLLIHDFTSLAALCFHGNSSGNNASVALVILLANDIRKVTLIKQPDDEASFRDRTNPVTGVKS